MPAASDIDLAATAGIGLPMGPLALLDLIGLDTSLSIMEVLRGEFGLARYTPAPLLRRLTDAGPDRPQGRPRHLRLRQATAPNGARIQDGNEAASAPDTVTLIGSGDEPRPSWPPRWPRAGINVTRNAAHPTDLVLIAGPAGQAGAAGGARGRAAGSSRSACTCPAASRLAVWPRWSRPASARPQAVATGHGAGRQARPDRRPGAGPARLPGRRAAVPASGRRGPDGAGRLRQRRPTSTPR